MTLSIRYPSDIKKPKEIPVGKRARLLELTPDNDDISDCIFISGRN
jgi:hypothetical protein